MKKTAFLILFLIFILAGCAAETDIAPVAGASSKEHSGAIFAMDTYMEIKFYGDEKLLEGAEDVIYSMEAALSVTDERSEIYAVNRDGGGEVSPETAELITRGLELCERTGGALDISVYPVVRAWGFTTGEYRVPGDSEINELLGCVDYEKIAFDGETVTLSDGMMIDLGSVAKGAASSRVVEYFRENGVKSALLNLGGNVHALGAKPDGSKWRIAVKNPVGSGNLCVLEIEDKAVITSGGYERYFEEDGETYWHIIDPATGYPAKSGLVSVTVIGDDGLLCDALSTSLFVMGLQNAAEFWRDSDDFEAVFVTEDGGIYVTEGLEDSFRLIESYELADYEVIRRG